MAEWKDVIGTGESFEIQAGHVHAQISPHIEHEQGSERYGLQIGTLFFFPRKLTATTPEAAKAEAEAFLRGLAREILAAVGDGEPTPRDAELAALPPVEKPHPADGVLGKHEGPLWDEFCQNIEAVRGERRTVPEPKWSAARVLALNINQGRKDHHPLTCSSPHRNELERTLVATPWGWKCPTCDYRQDWVEGAPLNPEELEKRQALEGG